MNDQVISSAGILQTRPKLSKVVIVFKLVVAVTNEREQLSVLQFTGPSQDTPVCALAKGVFSEGRWYADQISVTAKYTHKVHECNLADG